MHLNRFNLGSSMTKTGSRETSVQAGGVHCLPAETSARSLVCFHVAAEELKPAESTAIAVQLIRAGARV